MPAKEAMPYLEGSGLSNLDLAEIRAQSTVRRHLGRPDVSRVSPGSEAAVVQGGHADRLPVVPLVNEAEVPARKAERPDEEVEDDAAAVQKLRGFVLWCVQRCAPPRVDGRAEHVNRLPASVHPDKQNDAVEQIFELVVKGEASVASAEIH